MITATQNYWDNVWEYGRNLSIRIVITGTDQSASPVTLTATQIRDFTLDDQLTDDGTFQICNVPMRTLDFSFFDEDGSTRAIGLGGAELELYLGVTDDTDDDVMVGNFYINEVSIVERNVVRCECVDAMGFANINYEPTITYPTELYNVLTDVATVAGLTVYPAANTWNNADLIIAIPPSGDVTCRQMLQYIAQIVGSGIEARVGYGKQITTSAPVDTGKTIPLSGAFSEDVAQAPISITDVTYAGGNNATNNDTGFVINFADNPLMDVLNSNDIQSAMTDIYNTYGNTPIYPCRAKVSSCPALQTGDIVQLTRIDGSTFPILITHITQSRLSSEDIVCAGDTVEKHNYVMGGTLTSKVSQIGSQVSELSDAAKEQSGFIRIYPSQPLISIGKEGTGTSVEIDDESVTITGSDGATAVLESSQLSAPQAKFKNTQMGNWIWVSRTVNGIEDQNLTLKWIGG